MLDRWRDDRLARLDDRAFCRRVSLAGWELAAAAAEENRPLAVRVNPQGLPRTAARALRLFAAGAAIPLGAADPGQPSCEATAQSQPGGRALVTLRRLPAAQA